MEKFYKTLRKDLGYNEIEPEAAAPEETSEGKGSDGDITDNRRLNDMIKNAMLNREQGK